MKERITLLPWMFVTLVVGLVSGPTAIAESTFEVKAQLETETFIRNPVQDGYYHVTYDDELEFSLGAEGSELKFSRNRYLVIFGSELGCVCATQIFATAPPYVISSSEWQVKYQVDFAGTYTRTCDNGSTSTAPITSYFSVSDYIDPDNYDVVKGYFGCGLLDDVSALVEIN